ncbi:MAG TPA: iron ABC transporter permease [Steroidobacteraceae bacterium]
MKRPPVALSFALLIAAAVLSIAAAASIGSLALDPLELWQGLFNADDSLARSLVLDLRLPRALCAFATGATLALAGVLMQVLLRNPLADPYILGVSGGASVAALAAMLAGLGGLWIDAGAATGALGATLLVFALAHGEGGWTPTRLLLIGVVVAAGCGAIVSLMLALGSESQLRGMVFWLMGDFSTSTSPRRVIGVLVPVLLLAMLFSRSLNLLARGEIEARALGLPLGRVRVSVFVASAVLTAAAVTTAGSIGFVGLVTPHLVRMMLGSDHRVVVPAAAILGGVLLVLADLLARTVIAPRQLPVGALTALIGVPLFLALMRRQRFIG